MLKRVLILFLTFIIPSVCLYASGKTLSLDDCRKAAREKARAGELESIADDSHSEKLKIINHAYTPQLSIYGETHYQTDSPDPASISDLPFELHKLDRFQYHAGLSLTQSIYRGGSRKINREINDIDRDIDKLETESFLLELENTVDEVFLDIILASKEEEIALSHRNTLERKIKDAQNAFEQGHGYRSDILALEAGLADADANLSAYRTRKAAGRDILAELTGLDITEDTELTLPAAGTVREFSDPIFGLLDLQSRKLSAQQELDLAKTRPSVNAFGTVGYGLWPLNFFERDAQVYGIVGVSLVIPISSRQSTLYKNKVLSYQSDKLKIQREALDRKQNAENLKYDAELARIDALLEASATSIAKFEALCRELESMEASGLSSQSEYLDALEKLSAARISFEAYTVLRVRTQLMKNRNLLKSDE